MSNMKDSTPIVLFTGVQRLARSLRQRGFASACLRVPDEVISAPEDVDIWIPYKPGDFFTLQGWFRSWHLRDQVVAVINRREKRVFEHAYLNQVLGKIGLSLKQAEILRDKLLLRETLAAAAPHLNPVYEPVDLTLLEQPVLPFPFLLKPRNLFKSQLITPCQTREDWEHARTSILSKVSLTAERHGVQVKKSFLAETYIRGKEVSLDAFVTSNGEIIHTPLVDLTPASHWGMKDFHLAVRFVPSVTTPREVELVLEAIREATRALGLRATPIHVDLVFGEDRTMILDLAPRVGGYRSEMMDLAYGCSLDAMNLELALGRAPRWLPTTNQGVAVVEIFPQVPGRLTAIHGLETMRTLPSFHRFRQRTALGEAVGWASDGFRCPVFVVLKHPEPYQVREDVDALRRTLHLEVDS